MAESLLNLYFGLFLTFVLVLARLSPLVMVLPVIGSRSAPVRVRGLVAVAMAMLLTPLSRGDRLPPIESLIDLGVLVGGELLVGMSFGLAALILLAALHVTGQLAGQMSGMQLADVFDPGFDTTVPVFTQFLDLIAMAVFVLVGGHRQVIGALLDTFRWMPPGEAFLSSRVSVALVEILTQSFVVGIRAGAPLMISLLLAALLLGVISRTLPQLNLLALGFPINSAVTLAMLAMTLGAATWMLQDQTERALEVIQEAFLDR